MHRARDAQSELCRLGNALNARTTHVVDSMVRRSEVSGRTLDKVVEESFEEVGAASTVAVARWMAGEGEAVAREVGERLARNPRKHDNLGNLRYLPKEVDGSRPK